MSTMRAFLCGVPEGHCVAGHVSCSARLGKAKRIKAHASRDAAFNCYVRWLTRVRGYIRIKGKSRDFSPPDGNGPVIFLPKRSRFGGALRRGKEGNRYMPKRGVSCVIV